MGAEVEVEQRLCEVVMASGVRMKGGPEGLVGAGRGTIAEMEPQNK